MKNQRIPITISFVGKEVKDIQYLYQFCFKVSLYFQELLNQVQGRNARIALAIMSISNEVIAFINLKICEILKQNWYYVYSNPKYALRYVLRAETASIMGTSSSFDSHSDGVHICASKQLLSSHDENLMHISS